MRENEEKNLGYELAVNIASEKILLFILRHTDYIRLESGAKIRLTSKNGFLNSVTAFLEERYAEDFSLDDVAKSLQYTKSYFCHRFKDITGVTFWKYFTLFRLEKAVEKMKDFPNKRYTEIAGECGFKNIRSFNQSFKEYYRSSPREYSKRYLKNTSYSK
jgi:two-component system response regulator YesN